MARHKTATLTDGELQIMDVLWDRGDATVRDVLEVLRGDRTVAYSTVQTMLGILADKGFADVRKEGRAFVYRPLIGREQARTTALRHLISRFFGGSPEALAQALVNEGDVDLMEIRRLQQELADKEDA